MGDIDPLFSAYGVDRFLFVYGDKPTAGGRTGELTVRTMIEEARGAAEDPAFAGCRPFGVGVTSGLCPVPAWKMAADFAFVQVSFSLDALLRWRESTGWQVPVYAGVMVLASAGMARNLAAAIPDIDIPHRLVSDVERDRAAGVDAACEQILAIRDSGAFDGAAGLRSQELPPGRTGTAGRGIKRSGLPPESS